MSTLLYNEILSDINILNGHLNKKYTINDIPEEIDLQSTEIPNNLKEGCSILLEETKIKIKEYRKTIHSEDQKKLSQFMKNINGEEPMSEEIQKWWMNRY